MYYAVSLEQNTIIQVVWSIFPNEHYILFTSDLIM